MDILLYFYAHQAMALADMGRVEDTLPILRAVLEIESPLQKDKHTFFEETVCIFFCYLLLFIMKIKIYK